jgi:L-methionine (R)-S-oxide reductase
LEESKDLRRSGIVDRVAGAVNSDASDEAVLGEVVRLLRDVNPSWDWVGIYLLVGDTLVVGPHTGEYPEHSRIAVGEGVCGTAVAEGRNQVVKDVRERDNYLACSLSTRSEIVVLIREGGRIVGQFDVDSDEVAAFAEEDEALLGEVAKLVAPRCASMAEAL